MEYDFVVVGAGLSGLASAVILSESGHDVLVLEAGAEAGGRIRSVFDEQTGDFVADLGPSWVWPIYQPILSQWLDRLGLDTFPQYTHGNAVLDYGPEQPAQAGFIPSQDGNERVVGGSQALVQALLNKLPNDAVRLNSRVMSVSDLGSRVNIKTSSADLAEVSAGKIILALPPRIAVSCIEFTPPLPPTAMTALADTPTWMAPHAKVAILYEYPFWREMGLSGRIASRHGPIAECHDHCGVDGEPAAIWGFIGLPSAVRAEMGEGLEKLVREQLRRCFGEEAPEPIRIEIEDWSANPLVATGRDLSEPMQHPSVRPHTLRETYFGSRLCFAGSEMAEVSPGLIEGAFEAAERATALLLAD